jgi:hypothetical protein
MMRYRRIDYWKYQLVEGLFVATNLISGKWSEIMYGDKCLARLDPSGLLKIYEGYAWDGASGPAIDTPDFMTASLVHDVLYQFIRLGKLPMSARKDADQALYDLCISAGMNWFRAQYVYKSVRLFGENAAKPDERDINKIYEAP